MSLTRFVLLLLPLYLAQGLPGGLIAHGLPAIMREQGVDLALIGFLKLLALPWLLKFLWAPLIERSQTDVNLDQRRRRLIFLIQPSMAILLVLLGFVLLDLESSPLWMLVTLILCINTLAATQDIATDGLAVSRSPGEFLGFANSLQVSGYKIGMIIGGSGLLLLSSWFNWVWSFVAVGGLLLLLLLPLASFKFSYGLSNQQPSATAVSESAQVPTASPKTAPAATPATLSTNTPSLSGTYRSAALFFKESGSWAWLAVLLTYKVGDGLGSTMLKPMLVDAGWSLSELGSLTLQASIIGIVGAFAGGAFYRFAGRSVSLLSGLVLQTVAVSAFYFIALGELSTWQIRGLVYFEQFVDGLSTVALFACMMWHCRDHSEGSDYTIQASMQILLAGIFGALSGVLASVLGYTVLYLICAICGIFSLAFVLRYLRNMTNSGFKKV